MKMSKRVAKRLLVFGNETGLHREYIRTYTESDWYKLVTELITKHARHVLKGAKK